jgi:histidine kinase
MKLRTRLLISHLLMVAISIVLFAALSLFLTVRYSENEVEIVLTGGEDGAITQEATFSVSRGLSPQVRGALIRALIVAGFGAGLAAVALSVGISRRIVQPLRVVAETSRVIASGRYEARLDLRARDEVGELAQSFDQMAAALADMETTRRQLIADVSHELKTPLASIKGYMEGLQDGVIFPAPEVFSLVHREAQRLHTLVDDLQELSRIEAGGLALSLRPCQPARLLQTSADRLRPQYEEKGVTLIVEAAPDLPDVRADPDRVAQVLINLLGNALQYTPPGGTVIASAALNGHEIRVNVRDTGIGIDPAHLEHIFLRFYRVDKSRSRIGGGSGIGLTIARTLIEAMGGRLWAESDGIGHGSVFRFTLPLARSSFSYEEFS